MMELNSVDDWLNEIYEVLNDGKITRNGTIQVDGAKLKEIFEKIPSEVNNNKRLKGTIDSIKNHISFAEYKNELGQKTNCSEPLAWDVTNFFTIKNSIFSKYIKSQHEYINESLADWLESAEKDFKRIQDTYELCFYKSIDELEMAKMELREINSFFENGCCDSLAINMIAEPSSDDDFSEQELYDYYLSLLRGEFEFFISKGEYSVFKENSIKYTSLLDEPCIESLVKEMNNIQEIKSLLSKEWWLAVRVQALMWMRMYLKYLIETGNFNSYQLAHSTKLSIDDLVIKKSGFQASNPNKTIPALHKKLIEHSLIKDEGLVKFTAAFLNAKGSIEWLTIQSQLGYFVQEIKNHGIVTTNNNWKTAQVIFLVKGKPVKAASIKSGATQITASPKEVIDNIIKEVLSIH